MARKKKKTDTPRALTTEGYSYDELRPLIDSTLEAGISVLLRGHPGVGKSTLAAELAQVVQKPLIDIRLAQRDPAELCGVYFPDRESKTLALFPPQWVRDACDKPCFVFLDEVNAAVTKLHQAAAYQIVLEHRVGPWQFHPQTVVMAAGNLEEDNAIVTSLSSALCNRFAHYVLRVDARAWLDWAQGHEIAPPIIAYIGHHGEEPLYDNNGDYAFPSPRSWEMASRVFAKSDERDQKRLVASCVGLDAAERFFNFLRIYLKVDSKKIVEKGERVDFAKTKKHRDPSFIYAAVFSVAAYVSNGNGVADKHLPNVVKFLRSPGLDPEYVFLFLRQVHRNSEVVDRLKPLPEFRKLADKLVNLQAGLYQ